MKKLIINKTERNAEYHDFTYKDGHKTPVEKDGLVRCYLAESGMLKATERVDIAGSVSGKYVETDEVKCENGTPVINGKKYNIWGIGENYVIVSAVGDKHYIEPNADGSPYVAWLMVRDDFIEHMLSEEMAKRGKEES